MKGIIRMFGAMVVGAVTGYAVKRMKDQTDIPQVDHGDVLLDYPPTLHMDKPFRFAYACEDCGEMSIVHMDEDEYLETLEMLKGCDGIMCEHCGELNMFDDHNYESLK